MFSTDDAASVETIVLLLQTEYSKSALIMNGCSYICALGKSMLAGYGCATNHPQWRVTGRYNYFQVYIHNYTNK